MKSILRGLIDGINAFLVDSKVLRLPALGLRGGSPARRLKRAAARANLGPPAYSH
jgi:hypothetical protein